MITEAVLKAKPSDGNVVVARNPEIFERFYYVTSHPVGTLYSFYHNKDKWYADIVDFDGTLRRTIELTDFQTSILLLK